LKNPGALKNESSRLKITDKLELEEQGRILASSTYAGEGLHGPVKSLNCYIDLPEVTSARKERAARTVLANFEIDSSHARKCYLSNDKRT